MTGYIIKRILATIPVMVIVALFVFGLLHITPGDPAAIIAGDYASPADVEAIREKLGLNEPIHIQFYTWVKSLADGDMGVSVFSNLPVTHLIGQRVEATLMLSILTTIFALMAALPLGVLAAWKSRTFIDRFCMIFAVLGFSVPVFVIGYILMYVFAIQLKWLPVQGYKELADGLWPCIRSLILPSMALGTLYTALIARITRASVMEVLAEDYIRTAKAKGLNSGTILIRHALKNAAVPIVTIIGVGIALLIGGVVVTESVFNIPGLGRLTVDAILHRDYPVIQAVIIIFSGIYVLINLLVDLSYVFFDPRIRY
ncbi:MAG: ABC transporter permease [Dehalococcoidia bacterium]|nr:MAG: ABC transporter permease [Dehalococcoidia bacterium]